MRARLIAAAFATLALSACFGGGAPDALLTLTPTETRPVAQPRTAGAGEAVTVVVPSVPQALRTTRVPVYVSETVVQYLKDAVWVENPGPLFGRLLGETIAAKTGRVVLDPSQYSHDPGTRITGQLLRFGLDPNTMEVVVVYDAAMQRTTGGVTTNRFESRVAVSADTAAAVAPALNQAANQVAEQVAAWIGG
ncbi:MAG TPA: ABC-type transport auxiliary lipoprotein family protein [Allosphingosinicella sp.]|nr:ABC-type transport auxiliary lipoprotein family protein [Allosphingosinicella sp.]